MAKEQHIYLQALEHALKIAKNGGVEELEKEVRFRSSREVPLNVNRNELIACTRVYAKEEFMIISTAMAITLTEHLKLPPSILKDYLKYFNNLVQKYRDDEEKCKTDQQKMERNYSLITLCREWDKENKE